jgi:hypothetical protein
MKMKMKIKTKTRKTKTRKTKTTTKLNGGADFFGGLIQTSKQKNYSVPGEKYTKLLNPNLYISVKQKDSKNNKYSDKNSEKLKIIFNRGASNAIDISQVSNNTLLYSNVVTKEPYLFINSMGKYLIVMYKEIQNQNFEKIKLLYWLIGYNNYNIKKIFNYIEPNVPTGTTENFTIKIYKLPNNYMELNLIKIDTIVNHNNIYNEKNLIKAYNDLFNKYLKPYNLLSTTNINFKVKGSSNQGIDIFSMFDKNKQQQTKFAKFAKISS